MAPGNFFARVVQYLVNDALVKVLANNRAFQQFAVRSSEQAKALSKNAEEAARAIANSPTITEARKEATQASQDMRKRASEYVAQLRDELFRGRRG